MGACWGSPSSELKQSYSGNPGYRGGFSMTSGFTGFSKFSVAVDSRLVDRTDWDDEEILASPNLKEYSFADLKSATKNFDSCILSGEGASEQVFIGWVDEKTLAPSKFKSVSGMIVAVKRLRSESSLGFQEWQTELNFLGRLSHSSLVKLLGFCWEEKELLLVYEYMQKGSLYNHLFGRNSEPLSWDIRLKIAMDTARGLAFLHSSQKQVIMRGLNASNILLDGDYNAKISDFGLARLGPLGGDTHVSTAVIGTCGYVDPEYLVTGHLTVKCDVYGFGIVLLQILTGEKVYDSTRPDGQKFLIDWAKLCLAKKGKLQTIMDKQIKGQYSSKEAFQLAELALKCLDSVAKNRPSMDEVVEVLGIVDEMKKTQRRHITIQALPAARSSSISAPGNASWCCIIRSDPH